MFSFSSCFAWFGGHNCSTSEINFTKLTREEKSLKSLIIFPQSGPADIFELSYAKQFCAKGYEVYIINSWSSLKEISAAPENFYSHAQKAITLILANVHTPFIGLFGTGIGGGHTGVAANSQTKIDSFFIVTGGASNLEPMKHGELYKTKDIGMAIASEDTLIGDKTQNQIKEFLKPKKVITVSHNHFLAVASVWFFHSDEIIAFFDDSYANRNF